MSLSKENKVIIDGIPYYGGVNQPRQFVKVNVDCWHKIFDYLSLRDILAISQTCQRMRQIGGAYFCENFHGTDCRLSPYISSPSIPSSAKGKPEIKLERDDFLRFVDTLLFYYRMEDLRRYSSENVLGSLTTLQLYNVVLNENESHGCENALKNIATILLADCTIGDNFANEFLKACPKLKSLQMRGVNFKQLGLFRHKYPGLEHFEITFYIGTVPLASFLEQNPGIKSLQIRGKDLEQISLDTSTIRLDCLNIYTDISERGAVKLANRLKTAHERGHYKRLHLHVQISGITEFETFITAMRSFSPFEAFDTGIFTRNICRLIHLKELHISIYSNRETGLEAIAKNLINLERLWIWGTVDCLLPFFRCSKKLGMVINNNNSKSALNLFNLNELRQMGGMHSKILIGVSEDIYLETKWKAKNVNYNLVEITRAETIREHFVFNCG